VALPCGDAVERVNLSTSDEIVILIPVFNDWASLASLIENIDGTAGGTGARVLVIDDGSTEPATRLKGISASHLGPVEVLELQRNLGHQRAIAIGLSYVAANLIPRAVVVMDGDGEDAPEDVPRLLAELDRTADTAAVFAERRRRSERWLFRLGYHAYRLIHRALTGYPVKIGNFSVLPSRLLSSVVVSSDLWNHYAAAVVRAKVPITTIATTRAERITGQSKMSIVSLVVHGFSAIAVFGDRVAVRLLSAAGILLLTYSAAVAVVLALDVGALSRAALIAMSWGVVQLLVTLLVLVLLMLGARDQSGFIPLRDHAVFVRRVWAVGE